MTAASIPPPRAEIRRLARELYSDAILDAAEGLFIEAGYADSKMAEVAARAGVSVGTLYKHFASKEAVMVALSLRRREMVLEALDACEQIDDPRQRLVQMLDGGLAAAEEGGALFAVYKQLRPIVDSQIDALGEERTEAKFQRLVSKAYEDGVRRGEFRSSVSAHSFALALFGALDAEMAAWLAAGREGSLRDRGRALLDLLLEGARVR